MPRKSNGAPPPKVVTDLIERMKASGMTRIAIARSSGVSEREVYYLMSGQKRVGVEILTDLARVFGCEVVLRKVRQPGTP